MPGFSIRLAPTSLVCTVFHCLHGSIAFCGAILRDSTPLKTSNGTPSYHLFHTFSPYIRHQTATLNWTILLLLIQLATSNSLLTGWFDFRKRHILRVE